MNNRRRGWFKNGQNSPLSYIPPLDVYPDAIRAYGLRLLKSTYSGPLMQIRRTSDNSLLDIYPLSNGLLNENAILTFINNGSFSAVISIFYDQSGNNQNLVGVNNVFVIFPGTNIFEKINGKNTLRTAGGSFSNTAPFMFSADNSSIFAVVKGPDTNPLSATLTSEGNSSSSTQAYLPILKLGGSGNSSVTQFIRNNSNGTNLPATTNSGSLFDNNAKILYSRDNKSSIRKKINNISDINVNYTRSGTYTFNRFGLLCFSQVFNALTFSNLQLSEILYYNSNKDSESDSIIELLNNYYQIY